MNRKRWILLLVAVLAAVAAWPFVFPGSERIPITEAVRAEAFKGESFARLSDGYTHYVWSGPETGEVVVLVHGFSSPCFIWRKQADFLAAAGYRVLRYDLFGRGHSDRPDTAYGPDLYHRQLLELLDSQKITQPINLIGLSMGGPITMNFVDKHPEKVKRFGLVAPAGFGANVPGIAQLLRVPGLSHWIIQAFGDRFILGGIGQMASDNPEVLAQIQDAYTDQLQYAGYKRALLRTLIGHPMTGWDEVFARVGKQGMPSILFWGDADRVVPFVNSEAVRAAIPGIEFHPVSGGSHIVNYDVPDAVNGPLLEFLRK